MNNSPSGQYLADPLLPDAIRAQLDRILRSQDYQSTDQRRDFLRFVVDETLEGRSKFLKGVTIALSVFGRDASFDQQTDPVVRLEARRLRKDLDSYYAGPGRWDKIRISIPKGGYTPQFDLQENSQPADQDTQSSESSRPTLLPHTKRRASLIYTAIITCLALVLAMSWYIISPDQSGSGFPLRQGAAELDLPKGPIIAVLPFQYNGDDPERQYISVGITQQITTELIRFRDLWVLPLGAIQQLQPNALNPQTQAEELGADFVLEGSILEQNGIVNFTARLIDLKAARYIWVRSYSADVTPTSIYAAQDKIIHDVVGNLAGKYGILAKDAVENAKRKAPEHRDAYDCVLRYYSYQIAIRLDQHSIIKSCIERATVLDPNYAEAWAVLSNLLMQEIRFDLEDDKAKSLSLAKNAVKRAIELDPQSSEVYLMRSNLLFASGDITGFKTDGETALMLNPNNSTTLAHYGMRLAFSGSWEEGLLLMDKAIALNPIHPYWYFFPEVFYRYSKGEYNQALVVLNKIDMPNFFWVQLWQAAIHGQLGNEEQARTAIEKLLGLKSDFSKKAAGIISIWQLEEDLENQIKQGLRKAGLDLPI